MNIATLQTIFNDFFSTTQYFSLYDYLILALIFLAVLLFFLLSVTFRSNLLIAGATFFISFLLFMLSPFLHQMTMESFLRKIDFTLDNNDKLQYNAVYYVSGSITNRGKVDFKGCIVSANFIPKNAPKVKKIRYEVKPIFLHKEVYKKPLKRNETMDFKIIIPTPNPEIDFTLKTYGTCF